MTKRQVMLLCREEDQELPSCLLVVDCRKRVPEYVSAIAGRRVWPEHYS